ncbi:hypothetical protein Nepgr_006276 [Nepenthes gracilis]|uniref:Uncharacterized protein n=1 Tax=Nepenthes gracilis TaxID=150966 RepID=A0AAD3XH73_NEPGR|nr:hypothetical protein Nepgr_006276 [Nepenthes gracilis]
MCCPITTKEVEDDGDPDVRSGINTASFHLQSRCNDTIWPETQAGAGNLQLINGGPQLKPGQNLTAAAPNGWSAINIWGRQWCSFDQSSKGSWLTSDCGSNLQCGGAGGEPPATLAEFTVYGPLGFYNDSLVDRFNLPVLIIPHGGSGQCRAVRWVRELNAKEERTVACKSASM